MAVLWQSSLVPFIDPNGDPYAGAEAYFFDAGTTTPLAVYTDSALSIAQDHPVVANASGVFPAVFLPPTQYKVRVTDSDGVSIVPEVDGVDPPQAASYVPPDAGSTDITLLARTGDLKFRHDTNVHSGWVRVNGRTIGNAASGATERANADCSALFTLLWTVDSTLTVSGGRGGTAAGDFAANKTIALPDGRSRMLAGLAAMGNTNVALIADAQVDSSETADTLGATAGEATHALITAELASHTHTGTTGTQSANHTHGLVVNAGAGGSFGAATSNGALDRTVTSANESATHTHSFTSAATGSGTAHNNLQPTLFATLFIKL